MSLKVVPHNENKMLVTMYKNDDEKWRKNMKQIMIKNNKRKSKI